MRNSGSQYEVYTHRKTCNWVDMKRQDKVPAALVAALYPGPEEAHAARAQFQRSEVHGSIVLVLRVKSSSFSRLRRLHTGSGGGMNSAPGALRRFAAPPVSVGSGNHVVASVLRSCDASDSCVSCDS